MISERFYTTLEGTRTYFYQGAFHLFHFKNKIKPSVLTVFYCTAWNMLKFTKTRYFHRVFLNENCLLLQRLPTTTAIISYAKPPIFLISKRTIPFRDSTSVHSLSFLHKQAFATRCFFLFGLVFYCRAHNKRIPSVQPIVHLLLLIVFKMYLKQNPPAFLF